MNLILQKRMPLTQLSERDQVYFHQPSCLQHKWRQQLIYQGILISFVQPCSREQLTRHGIFLIQRQLSSQTRFQASYQELELVASIFPWARGRTRYPWPSLFYTSGYLQQPEPLPSKHFVWQTHQQRLELIYQPQLWLWWHQRLFQGPQQQFIA